VAILFVAGTALFIGWKSVASPTRLIFSVSVVTSGIIVNWQNIITGKILQFASHYYMVTLLIVFIISAILLTAIWEHYKVRRVRGYRNVVTILVVFLLIFGIVYIQRGEPALAFQHITNPPDISNEQSLMPAFDWFNNNTKPGSAVYTLGKDYEDFIPIYTNNNVYANGYTAVYLISDDEMENRWAIQNYWHDINTEYVLSINNNIWGNKFLDAYGKKETQRKIIQILTGKNLPPSVLVDEVDMSRILEKHKKFRSSGFENAIKTYDVDYIMLDLYDEKYSWLEKEFEKYKFLTLETKTSNFAIFRVIN
jgi:hypothetical protein